MSPNEKKVLGFLVEHSDEEGNCFPFAPIASDTRLDRRRVRLACRSLARKGLTKFVFPLWSDDGEPAGAGYCATEAGRKLLETPPAKETEPV